MPLARSSPSHVRRVASLLVPSTAPCLLLSLVAVPCPAEAACTNGDPFDCNPVGSTLNVAGRFVDPDPPFDASQCAGFTNTAGDDVAWNWENNCLPFIDQELILRVYAMDGSLIAGARLFDPQPCPWGPTVLGYDTDSFEGAGLLGHSGVCDGTNSTSLGWHVVDTSYCGCDAPDGGSRTCNDIYTGNGADSAIFYVGANSSSGAYEAVYGPPGGKGTCDLGLGTEIHELQIGIYVPNPDADGDGVLNFEDVCPEIFDPAQDDDDGDGLGDACDACLGDPINDVDEDDLCGNLDNCPVDANPMQQNADADDLGDLCDPCPGDVGNDPDADELCAAVDNCPDAYNPTQIDQDMDGIGAVCDVCPLDADDDGDGDGLCADADNCPAVDNPTQEDADLDGVGDPCDACPGDDDMVSDVDSDGRCAMRDNCPSVANPDQADADGDGTGDVCDVCPDDADDDIDADDVCAGVDNCPELSNPTQADEDGDGIGDACDTDEGTTSGAESSGGPSLDSSDDGEGFLTLGSEGLGSDGDTTGDGSESGSEGPGEDIDVDGCGCTTTPSRGAAFSLLAVVFGLRRRRSRVTLRATPAR